MKNLKISAKLLVSFGTIIVLMVLIGIGVFISTRSTINNVSNVDKDAYIQSLCKDLLLSFYEGRLQSGILYTQTNNEAYDEVVKSYVTIESLLSQMEDYINENKRFKDFIPQFTQTKDNINQWKTNVDAIQVYNLEKDRIYAELNELGENMTKSLEFVNIQYNTMHEEININRTTEQRASRIELARKASKISNDIELIRQNVLIMCETFDTSSYTETIDMLTETITYITEFTQTLVQQEAKNMAKSILESTMQCKEDVMLYKTENDQSLELVKKTQSIENEAVRLSDNLMLLLSETMSKQIDSTSQTALVSLIAVIAIELVSVIIAIMLAIMIIKSITGPLNVMKNVIDHVGNTGNLKFTEQDINAIDQVGKNKDEIGQSVASFSKMMKRLKEISRKLENVAHGDLTVDVEHIKPEDTIGNAMKKMVTNLNEMFYEINASTKEVSIGSHHIADGAQLLSQGATMQARAVEGLSASIIDVAKKTEKNADLAQNAADLALDIKENAQKGSLQMEDMVTAVTEINLASQSINKVIKVIDDIAFQTNILALNAAVEAARAGSHGKGFAVVAEEVRNLAVKSADAAKETDSMIVDSIQKAELGVKIAKDTAHSLSDIVSGINESTSIVTQIAQSSKEQAEAITEITNGIDQISLVIQQNSSTASESAAASEELNSQQTVLENHISQFRLKEGFVRMIAREGEPDYKRLEDVNNFEEDSIILIGENK